MSSVAIEQLEAQRRANRSRQLALIILGRGITYVLLGIGAIASLVPFLWMASTSLKQEQDAFTLPPVWIPNPPILDNYVSAWTQVPFGNYMANTVVITVLITVGQVIFCAFAGYAFARLRFPGRDLIFLGYLSTLMIPGIVTLIPSYILIRQLGWVDTYTALLAPGLLGNAFGTFLMKQFFLTLPGELEEAARIDGAGRLRIFLTIAVPLSKPAVATLAVLTFVNSWNSFLWPLIVINSDEKKMLTVGLSAFQGQFNTHWGWLMAGSMISLLPMLVVFFSAQRYFVQGIQFSGFK